MATTAAEVLAALARGDMEIEGRLVDASNTTLRVILSLGGTEIRGVYKPVRGERPLWDFPTGTLAGREVGAYLVSEALGWGVVPPTLPRDGLLGPGSVQLWLDELDEPPVGFVRAWELPEGWFSVAAAQDEDGEAYVLAHADTPDLAKMALFDAVVNNADRKGGHVLSLGERLYGVDHGVCFHVEPKLRTVLWGFAGKPIPEDLRLDLSKLDLNALALTADTDSGFGPLLSEVEIEAMQDRVDLLTRLGVYPKPDPDRRVIPWPPI
jgi:uncharacterized repeat protein (TIGR03843 family)